MNPAGDAPSTEAMPIRSVLAPGLFIALSLLATTGAMALDAGARAPEIGARDLDGHRWSLESLRNKVVIVDFWASWCDPCREEMPVLERLHHRYQSRGLVVIGISVDRTDSNVRDFLRRTQVSFPIIHDARHQIAGRYSPARMPSSYIFDRRGVVRHVHTGFRPGDARAIEREVRELLGR